MTKEQHIELGRLLRNARHYLLLKVCVPDYQSQAVHLDISRTITAINQLREAMDLEAWGDLGDEYRPSIYSYNSLDELLLPNRPRMIAFDIETGPLPMEQLERMVPAFDPLAAVPDMGEFDRSSVKLGALKDPVKIGEKIAVAQAQHNLDKSLIGQRREEAREKHTAKHTERAALSPLTGRVLAIGMGSDLPDSLVTICNDCTKPDGEVPLLQSFWDAFRNNPLATFVGHNILGFDLPFMIRRSWLLGVDLPGDIRDQTNRYWSFRFADTMQVWSLGNRGELVSLDTLDKYFGGQGKPEGIDGGDFARLYHGTPEERLQAINYLRNDVDMTYRVARQLLIV